VTHAGSQRDELGVTDPSDGAEVPHLLLRKLARDRDVKLTVDR
jgi:hypothetical protein